MTDALTTDWIQDNSWDGWYREGLTVGVQRYTVEPADDYSDDGFDGYTLAYLDDGYPAGPTDAYMRIDDLDEAKRLAEHYSTEDAS